MLFIFYRSEGHRRSVLRPAIGMYVLASRYEVDDYDAFYAAFCRDKEYLDSSRPTAVNLSWALKRMEGVVTAHANEDIPAIVDALHQEAMVIRDEDIAVCHKIGEYGMELLKPGDGVLTHCKQANLQSSVLVRRQHRSIWQRNTIIICVSFVMKQDLFYKGHD